jgi:Protein of unknown function (DUF2934)
MAREDEIRTIAYYIWQQEGCIDGHDCEHWIRAEAIWENREKQQASAKNELAGSRKSPPKTGKTSAKKSKTK